MLVLLSFWSGAWFSRPRVNVSLLPPRAIITSSKLTDIFGELDKFVRKKTGLSLHSTPQKDLKSSKCIIALVAFSILANILVTERGKPTMIQALSNYVAFTQRLQRSLLEDLIELHPVTQAMHTGLFLLHSLYSERPNSMMTNVRLYSHPQGVRPQVSVHLGCFDFIRERSEETAGGGVCQAG